MPKKVSGAENVGKNMAKITNTEKKNPQKNKKDAAKLKGKDGKINPVEIITKYLKGLVESDKKEESKVEN